MWSYCQHVEVAEQRKKILYQGLSELTILKLLISTTQLDGQLEEDDSNTIVNHFRHYS
jgi:hypothetical protein